ncbi:hypothetical protein NCS55_01502900 [Fusarium keratoplasticum]|nr:hypothetical protein NCS55_01502900 [Fusarium keratoplasticum]
MASSTTNPPAAPDPFDLGIHTPANLNRGARAALLQNSPAIVNGPIGASPDPGRMAQTPSSPLNATTTTTTTAAAATEGARPDHPSSPPRQQPVSIVESANRLAHERVEEYNAKLTVFQAFCAKFEEAAQQFTTGPERQFAQHPRTAASLPHLLRLIPAIYPPNANGNNHIDNNSTPLVARSNRRPSPHPERDLRVFIRLEASAPARAQNCYAIRTHICGKLGAISNKIRQVFPVRSGWAILTADPKTRDYLVEKQAEWAADLGATTIETSKTWFTYVISDLPRRLTDFHGNEVDVDSIVNDEIEIQTGLKPVDVRPARQTSEDPLTKTLLVSFLKPTKKYCAKHAGTTIPSGYAVDGLTVNGAARRATPWLTALQQSNAPTA